MPHSLGTAPAAKATGNDASANANRNASGESLVGTSIDKDSVQVDAKDGLTKLVTQTKTIITTTRVITTTRRRKPRRRKKVELTPDEQAAAAQRQKALVRMRVLFSPVVPLWPLAWHLPCMCSCQREFDAKVIVKCSCTVQMITPQTSVSTPSNRE